MFSYAGAGFEVPRSEGGICRGGEEDAVVTGPVEVEDCAFVTVQLAVVLARTVGSPEEDTAVHAARGDLVG